MKFSIIFLVSIFLVINSINCMDQNLTNTTVFSNNTISISNKRDNSTVNSNTTLITNIETKSFNILSYIKSINPYTLILICAFLSGLLLLTCLICLALCICKSVNRINKNKLPEMTNPMYDEKITGPTDQLQFGSKLNVKYSPVGQTDDNYDISSNDYKDETKSKGGTLTNQRKATLCEGETDLDIEPQLNRTPSEETLTNGNKHNLTTSSSSSSLSFNRVPDTPKTPSFKIKLSEQDHEDATDHTPLFNKNSNKKTIGSSLFTRTISESHDKLNQNNNNNNNINSSISLKKLKEFGSSRKSIASSTTSIQHPQQQLNFQLIQNDIDDMAIKKSRIKTESSSSNIVLDTTKSNATDSNDDLNKQKSISDIYIEFIKTKRQEQIASKQKSKLNDLKNESNNKRHSINAIQISLNPNGISGNKNSPATINSPNTNLVNASNLLSNDSMSVDTLGSEKSCY